MLILFKVLISSESSTSLPKNPTCVFRFTPRNSIVGVLFLINIYYVSLFSILFLLLFYYFLLLSYYLYYFFIIFHYFFFFLFLFLFNFGARGPQNYFWGPGPPPPGALGGLKADGTRARASRPMGLKDPGPQGRWGPWGGPWE